jgi:hypothetical protein
MSSVGESLSSISQQQAALNEEILTIKAEISVLKQELLRDQDPERMQLVQSLIGVSCGVGLEMPDS